MGDFSSLSGFLALRILTTAPVPSMMNVQFEHEGGMDKRKAEIINMLRITAQVNTRDLASRFGVSGMTIRRDLEELEKQGLIIRTHGGAISSGKLRFIHGALPDVEVSETKAGIGKQAAALVKPGEMVMIDTGTTALEVARHLPRDPSITVVTTSLGAAQELYRSGLTLFLLGGLLRDEFPGVYGPTTEKMLAEIRVDTLFIGCDGAFSDDGFYSNDLHISSLEQAMTRIASQVVVVTESAKFGRRAFSRYAKIQEVSTVVTDVGISPRDRLNLEERGVQVILAAN